MATITRLWLQHITLRRNDRGASLVEYALLVAFIALACFAAIVFLGEENEKSIDDSADSISTATN